MPSLAASWPPFIAWFRRQAHLILLPVVALLLMLVFMELPFLPIGQRLENLTIDLRFQARAPFDPPADPRLVLIGIDQQSLDYVGRWPWPHNKYTQLFEKIAASRQQPKTFTTDILFADSKKLFLKDTTQVDDAADRALAEAIQLLPVVITGALSTPRSFDPNLQAEAERRTLEGLAKPGLTVPLPHVEGNIQALPGEQAAALPLEPIRQPTYFGFVDDTPSKVDGVRRTLPLVVRLRDRVYPSLSLQTLLQALQIDPENVTVQLGRQVTLRNGSGRTWTIPIDAQGSIVINYRREDSFRNLTFVGLAKNLIDHLAHDIPLDPACVLDKKIVFLGGTALGVNDLGPTPLRAYSPLVYTHLNVINSVLRHDYLVVVPRVWLVLGFLFVSWVTLFSLQRAPIYLAVSVPVGVGLLYVLGAFTLFWLASWQFDLVWPVLGYGLLNFESTVRRWREEQKSKQEIRSLFARMLAPEVLDHLMAHPENLKLGGTTRPVTIFFSDIRDYTKISEHMETEELVRQLNIYFERMVACIKTRQGTFHKFIGDAIMSSWSAIESVSLGVEEDARNAVRAALDMRRELRLLNEERAAQGLLPLRIGIGLNHGEVLAGQIGTANAIMEFTVMGDPVNVASRLEGMTKLFRTDIAIGETVQALIGDAFLVRRLGRIVLKGKSRPMMVYEVLARREEAEQAPFPAADLATYETALDHYYAARFPEALALFSQLQPLHPHDYCIETYRETAATYLTIHPPDPWDGRIILDSK